MYNSKFSVKFSMLSKCLRTLHILQFFFLTNHCFISKIKNRVRLTRLQISVKHQGYSNGEYHCTCIDKAKIVEIN